MTTNRTDILYFLCSPRGNGCSIRENGVVLGQKNREMCRKDEPTPHNCFVAFASLKAVQHNPF